MFFGGSFFKNQISDIWNFQWIKYLGTGLSYLKNWGIWVNHCSNYGASKLLLQFTEYLLDQLNNKHAKIAINSTIQHFEGCSENKYLLKVWRFLVHPPWWPCKVFAEIKRKPSFNGQYFHEYQTFGFMKMHNMCKIWFSNNIFSLLRWNKKCFSWFFKDFQLPEIILGL